MHKVSIFKFKWKKKKKNSGKRPHFVWNVPLCRAPANSTATTSVWDSRRRSLYRERRPRRRPATIDQHDYRLSISYLYLSDRRTRARVRDIRSDPTDRRTGRNETRLRKPPVDSARPTWNSRSYRIPSIRYNVPWADLTPIFRRRHTSALSLVHHV